MDLDSPNYISDFPENIMRVTYGKAAETRFGSIKVDASLIVG